MQLIASSLVALASEQRIGDSQEKWAQMAMASSLPSWERAMADPMNQNECKPCNKRRQRSLSLQVWQRMSTFHRRKPERCAIVNPTHNAADCEQSCRASERLGTRRKNGPGWLWLHLFLCWSERWPIQRAKTSIRNKSLFRSQSFASVNFPTTAPHPSLILTINSRIRSEDHNQAGLLLGEEVVLTIY